MNPTWKQSPFLRLLLPMILGIVCYLWIPKSLIYVACILGLISIFSIISFQFLKIETRFKLKIITGVLINTFIISIGYLLPYITSIENTNNWYQPQKANYENAFVRIHSEVETKPKTYKAIVEIKQLMDDKHSIETKGEAIIYFQKNEKSKQLREGDWLLVKQKFLPIKNTNNPGSFNYANYCHLRNIYESAYLREHEFQFTNKNTTTSTTLFNRWNFNTRKILNQYITESSAKGIAEALLIGYRKNVDDETWQTYSNTGIVHVIAISGMHMAMIYGSMIWLMFRIPFFKRKKIGAYVIAILTMWLFACLTGLPPSVTRSAIMFTFIGVGEIIDRKMSIYNNLAASAFCLLCYNPFWLVDVGFQLSYTAVLSMLLFFEKFYQLNYFSNYVVDKIWAMIAGTLSAQVLTIPIIIYYFHQFPLLFLVSNLIAIPMTGFILYAEIGLVLFSWFTPLAKIIGVVISKSILFLNYVVLKISQLSFVSWTAIQVNEWQVVLLFLCIVFLGIYFYYKKVNMLIASLGAMCMFLISTLFIRKENLQQQKMIVYSLPKQSALGFVNGNQIYFTNDSITKGDDKFTFTPSKIFFQAKETTGNFIQKEITEPIQFYFMSGKKVAIVNSLNISTTQPIEIDYLIIAQKCLATKEWINNHFKMKQIIVDNTIPFWNMDALKENLKEVSNPVHYVSEQGAFVVDL